MRRTPVAVAVSLLVGLAALILLTDPHAVASRAAETRLDLMAPAVATSVGQSDDLSIVLRSREVELKPEDIDRLLTDAALDTVFLGLFPDARLTVEIVRRGRIAVSPSGSTGTLSGRVVRDRHSTARLSIADGRIDALISAGKRLFRITPAEDGRHQISELARTPPRAPEKPGD